MSKEDTIGFLISFNSTLALTEEYIIDLTDMRLHLCGHPLAFFGKLNEPSVRNGGQTSNHLHRLSYPNQKKGQNRHRHMTPTWKWLHQCTLQTTVSLHERHSLLSLYHCPLESEPH